MQHRTYVYMNKIETDRKEKVVHIMEISNEKLAEMAALNIKEADISLLSDLKDIKIDESAPVKEKINSFAEQTGNIYVNRIGDYIVKVSYQESGAGIDEKLEQYIRRMAEEYI